MVESILDEIKKAKDIGFHNVDENLVGYVLRIDGREIGPPLDWQSCKIICDWLKAVNGNLEVVKW